MGFSLVIVKLCSCSAEWPGQSPFKQVATAHLGTSQVYAHAAQAPRLTPPEWHGGTLECAFSQGIRSEVTACHLQNSSCIFPKFLDGVGRAGVVGMRV